MTNDEQEHGATEENPTTGHQDFGNLTPRQLIGYARKLRAHEPTGLTPEEEAKVREWESRSIRAGIAIAAASWNRPAEIQPQLGLSPEVARLGGIEQAVRQQIEDNRLDADEQKAVNRWALRWASIAVVVAFLSLVATVVFGIMSANK